MIPRFYNLEKSMPIYMYMLAFTSYNQIKERDDDNMYAMFRSFYAAFKVIDSIIEGVFDSDSAKKEFILTYEKAFNLQFNASYLTTKSSQIEELEDEVLVEDVESDDESLYESQSNFQKGGLHSRYRSNRSNQSMPSISREVVYILNDDKSNLTFQVNVHLTLAPGEAISRKDIPSLACESRLQAIKMNVAKIMGRQYFPTPRTPKVEASGTK